MSPRLKFQFKLLHFLLFATVAAAVTGVLIRNHDVRSSALTTSGGHSTTYLDDGTRFDISHYGNSVHELVLVVVVERNASGAILGSYNISNSRSPRESGIWIEGNRLRLGDSIQLVYFSQRNEPIISEVPFDQTKALLHDLELRYPDRDPEVKKWVSGPWRSGSTPSRN